MLVLMPRLGRPDTAFKVLQLATELNRLPLEAQKL